jgi:hypothetical protein
MGTKAGFQFPLEIFENILLTFMYREVPVSKELPRY